MAVCLVQSSASLVPLFELPLSHAQHYQQTLETGYDSLRKLPAVPSSQGIPPRSPVRCKTGLLKCWAQALFMLVTAMTMEEQVQVLSRDLRRAL